MITITNGKFQSLSGGPLANGILTLMLSTDSTVIGSNQNVVAGIPIVFQLDSSGDVPVSSKIWSNAELTQTTYYSVRLYDANGTPVLRFPLNWIFKTTAGGTQDLGSMVNATIPAGE